MNTGVTTLLMNRALELFTTVKKRPRSSSDIKTSSSDTASDSTNDTSFNHLDSLESVESGIKKLKTLASEFRQKLNETKEIKSPDDIYKLLIEFLYSENPHDLDSLIKFYTVQRCTSRRVIRSIVKRLTTQDAKLTLLRLLDSSLVAGVALTPVEPHFRQTWIMELIRLHPDEVLSPTFKKILNKYQGDVSLTVVSNHCLAKLYGRLTTVLDHQYRLKLKKDATGLMSDLSVEPSDSMPVQQPKNTFSSSEEEEEEEAGSNSSDEDDD